MPNRIAGITVEINGSTTGLSKALEKNWGLSLAFD